MITDILFSKAHALRRYINAFKEALSPDKNLDDFTPKDALRMHSIMSSYIAHKLEEQEEGLGTAFKTYTFSEFCLPKDSDGAVYTIYVKGGAQTLFDRDCAEGLTTFLEETASIYKDRDIEKAPDKASNSSYKIQVSGKSLDMLVEDLAELADKASITSRLKLVRSRL